MSAVDVLAAEQAIEQMRGAAADYAGDDWPEMADSLTKWADALDPCRAAVAEVYAQRDVAMAFADEMEEDAAYSSGEEAVSVIRRQVLDEYARKLRAALARAGGAA